MRGIAVTTQVSAFFIRRLNEDYCMPKFLLPDFFSRSQKKYLYNNNILKFDNDFKIFKRRIIFDDVLLYLVS